METNKNTMNGLPEVPRLKDTETGTPENNKITEAFAGLDRGV